MSFNKPRTTLYCLTCNKAFKLHLTEKKNRMNHGNGRIKVKCDLRIKNWTELKKKIKVWNTLIISELHHHYSFCCDNNCKYLVWNDYSMLLNWSSQPYNTSASIAQDDLFSMVQFLRFSEYFCELYCIGWEKQPFKQVFYRIR